MNKSVLALSTALSILAFSPAIAQTQSPLVDCTIAANASDPACMNQQNNNATGTGAATQDGTTGMKTDQNAQGTTGTTMEPSTNAQGTTGATTDQNAQGTTGTTMEPSTNAEGTTGTTMDANQNAETTTTGTSTQQMSNSELFIPADQLSGGKLMSANDFIGKTVYDSTGANIGEVNDMIVSGDGNVEAVILGVGGFLGIGEKDVAVNADAIQMVQDGNAQRLVVEATKETLDQAPTYDRANRRYADSPATGTGMTTDTTTGSTTAPAPATNLDTTTGNSGGVSGGGSNNNTTGQVDCTLPANAADPACANKTQQ